MKILLLRLIPLLTLLFSVAAQTVVISFPNNSLSSPDRYAGATTNLTVTATPSSALSGITSATVTFPVNFTSPGTASTTTAVTGAVCTAVDLNQYNCTFSSASISSFVFVIKSIKNPNFAVSLSNSTTNLITVTFVNAAGTATVIKSSTSDTNANIIASRNLQCTLDFIPTVSSTGMMRVTVKTSVDLLLASQKQFRISVTNEKWDSYYDTGLLQTNGASISSLAFNAYNGSSNTAPVLSIARTFTSNKRSISIVFASTTTIPAGSTLYFEVDQINTPTFQTTDMTFGMNTNLMAYGFVETNSTPCTVNSVTPITLTASLQNGNIQVNKPFVMEFLTASTLGSYLMPSDVIQVTYPSLLGLPSSTSSISLSMNSSSTPLSLASGSYLSSSRTQSFTITDVLTSSGTSVTGSNQAYSLIFSPNFTMPRNTQSQTINFVFYRKNSRFIVCQAQIAASAGPLVVNSITPTSSAVADITTYTFSIVCTNSVSNVGGLVITFPSELAVQSPCTFTFTSPLTSSGSCSISSNTITISGAFAAQSINAGDNLVFTISSIRNPLSTAIIASNFTISSYDDMTLTTTLVDTISFTPTTISFAKALISNPTMSILNKTVSAATLYTFSWTNPSPYAADSIITITYPSDISVVNSSITLTSGGVNCNILSSTAPANSITITVLMSIANSSSLVASVYFYNMNRTGSVTGFSIATSTKSNSPIDYSTVLSDMINNASAFTSVAFNPDSTKATSQNATLSIVITPSVSHPVNTVLVLQFNTSEVGISGVTSITTGVTIVSIISSTLTLSVSTSMTQGVSKTITLSNMKYPRSLKPSSIIITSYTSTALTSAINTLTSTFTLTKTNTLTLAYNSQSMNYYLSTDKIQLVLTVTNPLTISDIIYIYFNSFYTFTSPAGSLCQQSYLTCTFDNVAKLLKVSTTTGYINNTSIDIGVLGFKTGSLIGTSNTQINGQIQAYTTDSSGVYKIDASVSPLSFSLTCGNTISCMTCLLNNHSYCTGCYSDKSITSLIYLVGNNNCTNNCSSISQFYYAQGNVCQTCASPCYTCTSKYDCNTCLSAFPYLYQNSTNSTCNSTCISGYYSSTVNSILLCRPCDSTCATCNNSATYCLTCSNSANFVQNGVCVSSCSDGYYPLNKECRSCDPSCRTCTNATACTSCITNYVQYPSLLCGSSCPTGTALNLVTNTCGCQSPCDTCSGVQTSCLSCLTDYLYSNTCVPVCPDGTIASNKQCLSCTTNCKICTLTTCTTCLSNAYLFNGSCYSDCNSIGTEYDKNAAAGTCVKCPTGCDTCNATTQTNCSSCTSNYVLDTSSSLCIEKCVLLGNCSAPVVCSTGYVLNGGTCVPEQPSSAGKAAVIIQVVSLASLTAAGVLSKLLVKITFLPYSVMSMVSVLEMCSYLVVVGLGGSYIGKARLLAETYTLRSSGTVCVLVAILLNYLLNGLHLLAYFRYIQPDPYFMKNKKKKYASAANTTLLVFATLTNFRLYQIVFSCLCSVELFKSRLVNTSKLTPLNVLNWANLAVSSLAAAGCIIICSESRAAEPVFLAAIASVVIIIVCVIFTIIGFLKDESFFQDDTKYGTNDVKEMHETHEQLDAGVKYEIGGSSIIKTKFRGNKVDTMQNLNDEDRGDIPIEKRGGMANKDEQRSSKIFDHVHQQHQSSDADLTKVIKDVDINQSETETLPARGSKKRKERMTLKQDKSSSSHLLAITEKKGVEEDQEKVESIINDLNSNRGSVVVQRHMGRVHPTVEDTQSMGHAADLEKTDTVIIKMKKKDPRNRGQLSVKIDDSSESKSQNGDSIDLNFIEKFYQQDGGDFSEPSVVYDEVSPSHFNIENQRFEESDIYSDHQNSSPNKALQKNIKHFSLSQLKRAD